MFDDDSWLVNVYFGLEELLVRQCTYSKYIFLESKIASKLPNTHLRLEYRLRLKSFWHTSYE
jgi:hypothetical protein